MKKITLNNKYIIATGTLAEGFMNKIKNKILKKFIGLELKVIAIEIILGNLLQFLV